MDSGELSRAELADILRDLDRVNALTRGVAPTLAFLSRATAGWPAGSELRVADFGSGRGGMLREVYRWAQLRGFRPRLTGVDLNPHCVAEAIAATDPAMDIDWHMGDLFSWKPEERPHFILSALFTHHLDDETLVRLLRWQDELALKGWFVNDLHRHPLAFHGFRLMAWALRFHPVVRSDGAISVRRSFTRADWRGLLARAGITDADIRWHPLFRLCVAKRAV